MAHVLTGKVCQDRGNFGFIKLDAEGEPDMFLLRDSCQHLGGIPPVGTYVQFEVVVDQKTGRPRAENVAPLGAEAGDMSDAAFLAEVKAAEMAMLGGQQTGTVTSSSEKFGFIQQDSGGPDMFMIPEKGQQLPPIGARVSYTVTIDKKTGRERAEHIQMQGAAPQQHHQRPQRPQQMRPSGPARAPVVQHHRSAPPAANAMLHGALQGAVNTTVHSAVDTVIGKVLEGVMQALPGIDPSHLARATADYAARASGAGTFAPAFAGGHHHQQYQQAPVRETGMMLPSNGKFGFIKPDSGGADMFMLPPFYPEGTRLSYDVVADPRTGRPRAENVEPLQQPVAFGHAQARYAPAASASKGSGKGKDRSSPYGGGGGGGKGKRVGAGVIGGPPAAAAPVSDEVLYGTVNKHQGKFAFIEQEGGGPDMFCIPLSCSGFGGECPPVGTRVSYTVVLDSKTGRPRADGVTAAPLDLYA
eukprot:TRINITY_DN396_c2_g1_i1.p1 TRINITY_DN396_c2_g1~~TRINITY_DN396_c2_g1_i1.p1  ORF type:complete len:498 (+),score=79.61 TRINITY_DN396_c2_g1_i1:84-1496(+)